MLNTSIAPENANEIMIDQITSVTDVVDSETVRGWWCSGYEGLKLEVSSLNEKINRDDQLLSLHDLGRMYRYYVADSIIVDKFYYFNWDAFVETAYDIESKITRSRNF